MDEQLNLNDFSADNSEMTPPEEDAQFEHAPAENDGYTQSLAAFGEAELAHLRAAHGVTAQNLSELVSSEGGERVLALWRSGVPLTDAYAAVNLAAVTAKRTAAAKQSALNAVLGKSHLAPTGGGASDEVHIPPEVYQQYKALLPGWSDAEIRKSYTRYQNR